MDGYRTIEAPARDEFTERRSRFIGHIAPVATDEEAVAFVNAIREQHREATHNVYAYVLRQDQLTRFSDDGEPQGTAGQPMLNVFLKEEVTNAVCVVTRYFGGILLGAGGLTRAYGGTAKLALDAAGVSRMRLWASLVVPCPYPLYERMRLLVEKCGGVVENADFGMDVLLTALLPAEDVDDFQEKVTELSAGTVEVLVEEERFQPGPP